MRRYVDALVGAGARVDVLCLRERVSVEPRDGVRIFTIPLGYDRRSEGRFLLEYGVALLLFTVRLLALYVKNRYHLIQVHNIPDFLVFTALIPRMFGSKLILDNRDPMPEFYRSKFAGCRENGMIIRLIEAQEKLSAMLVDAVITANTAFKDNLVNRGTPAEKIVVINNLPDPEVFDRERYSRAKRDPARPFTLIYPGTIAPRYGLEVAIRALPTLRVTIPNIRLIIIGAQTEHASELARLAEQLDVSSLVQLKDAVPLDDVPRHLAAADVGIYPALPDPHMSIATPTKVLEYVAMGLPVVASRLRVLEALFDKESVLFFEPGDVEGFARGVLELAHNPARRHELMGQADRAFVRRHRWHDERCLYLDVLNTLLPPDSRPLRLETSAAMCAGTGLTS
ncbi:MAG: glycosyltransferase family 4 protein [Chloroflexota bacterium]|nr:glycosyltransferase family 4 protein [Chloroflexota bacterium]